MFDPTPLPYDYTELEPYIDEQTMRVHYDKHYTGYTKKLNAALEGHEDLQDKSIEELLTNLEDLPSDVRKAVRNNGGGYYNHTLFWQMMSPEGGGEPEGDLLEAIEELSGSFEDFKSEFSAAAAGVFGSGWAWLVVNDQGELEIVQTPNQDNPISDGLTPILGIDVWEHAYYLKHQNVRADYIEAWWDVVNWDYVTEAFANVVEE